MASKELFLGKYDLNLAITARKILIFETHKNEEIAELVWQPTLILLKDIEILKPKSLTFLTTPPSQDGSMCFLDILGPQNKIAYIGTVQTKQKAIAEWQEYCNIFANNPAKIEKLTEFGWRQIRKHHNGCYIPLASDDIHKKNLEEAIRRYLKTFAPLLENTHIQWIHKRDQTLIEKEIYLKAKKMSKPTSVEETQKILFEDFQEI